MLLDSNIIIYATNDNKLLKIISEYEILNSSLITNIEVLGFHKISEPKKKELEGFFNSINILEVSNPIADKAISLRQIKNISLGDSIIAATAILHNLPLVTANTSDFKWIKELNIINPLED